MRRGVCHFYSFSRSGTAPVSKANKDGSEMMLYQNLDSGLDREHRAQIRREVEQNRLEARLAATRSGLDEAASRKSPAARSAAVVMALFR